MNACKLTPAFKDYLWGGDRLKTDYGKDTKMSPLAESWELSCHPDGENIIASGAYQGRTLSAVIEECGREKVLGSRCARFEYFPVLIKLIDAQNPLSIQVHPDDAYALKNENSYGKTEMWYILDAQPDSFIYYGVNREVTAQELRGAIEDNTLESLLGKRPVKRGDVAFIQAGTLHAIGAGILLCEIQQNSNLTYRVYDYGRRGADGKLRELHVDKALAVTTLTPASGDFAPQGAPEQKEGGVWTLLSSCDYFTVHSLRLSGQVSGLADGSSFCSIVCVDGDGSLACGGETLPFHKGDSLFIPADAGAYTISGSCGCVVTTI